MARKDVRGQYAWLLVVPCVCLVVDGNDSAVNSNAAEQPHGLCVGVDLRIKLQVRRARCLSADGSYGNRCVSSERHCAATQAFDAPAGGENENDIAGLYAKLEAKAATGKRNERWIAPLAVAVTNGQYALATLATDDETCFDDIGNYGDTLSPLKQQVRDAFIWDFLNGDQGPSGGRKAIFLTGRSPSGGIDAQREGQ